MMQPKAHISELNPYGWLLQTSGERYKGVPMHVIADDRYKTFDIPKSPIFKA